MNIFYGMLSESHVPLASFLLIHFSSSFFLAGLKIPGDFFPTSAGAAPLFQLFY